MEIEKTVPSAGAEQSFNYFNYFTEIEDAFVRRRGKHLLLSSMDWALIESWKEMNIPLHVALRGVEKAFDSWESKPRKRTVKTLLYCQEEVEAQYAEWLEARIGADDSENEAGVNAKASEDGLPFSREAIVKHLDHGRSQLLAIAADTNVAYGLKETIHRAVALLDELQTELRHTSSPNAQKLEVSLTGIERMLSESISLTVGAEQLSEQKAAVKGQLKPYRGHMEQAVYDQTFQNLLLKALREKFGIPRLSLFYL